MQHPQLNSDELIAQNEDLKSRLEEAQDVISAIRSGEVDAVIIKKDGDPQIFTLRSADHTYRIFIEKMRDGAVTLNRDGIVLYSNSSFADMIGLALEDVLGKSFKQLLPAEYNEGIGELIDRAWKQDCKAEVILPGLKPTPVLLSLNLLEIDGGQSLSIIVSDLSFQKESQEQRKTIELKDEFISIASHELKTPVTSIKGYIQLLKFGFMQEGNKKAEEMLTRADMQVNKLSALINELLDVKKIETGHLQFRTEIFDFCELVTELTDETVKLGSSHQIVCNLNTSCKVHGDRDKLGQVITNLLENAIKYSPIGSSIHVSTILTEDKVRLCVQDFGMGVPHDQQTKIFERFYRVVGKEESTYSGLGLGLYISAEIVKRHNGAIGVESEYGKGSTFYFELPIITSK